MIKANELRIGNWIKDKYDNFIQVNSICKYGINVSTLEGDLYCDFHLDEILGIPLTSQILERCGFNGTILSKINEPNIKIGIGDDKAYIGNPFSTSAAYIAPIKYLHQLQNLYFSLTGEELEAKQLAGKNLKN